MVLPTEVSLSPSLPDANADTTTNIKTAVGGGELLLTAQGLGGDDDGAGAEGGGEDGEGIAHELIRVSSAFLSRFLHAWGQRAVYVQPVNELFQGG